MNVSDLKLKVILFFTILLFSTLMEASPARRKTCTPLPQCCRRYVHSVGCRGVTAKRNSYVLPQQENILKNTKYLLDVENPTTNSQRSLEQNEEFEGIDSFRNVVEDGMDYF